MNNLPKPWEKFQPKKSEPADPVAESSKTALEIEKTVTTAPAEQSNFNPVVIMTEMDSIVSQRINSQPKSLAEIEEASSKILDLQGDEVHRLSLPLEVEKFSFDCTRGSKCQVHRRDESGKILHRGKFIFRWQFKEKRALDHAMNVKGWFLVNKAYFPDFPRHLYSVNGGIEIGDSILSFMPFEKALKIREFPSQRSVESLRSRITPVKGRQGRMLMTGNPNQEHVYEPDMGAEESETGDGSAHQPGSIQVDD